jgi:hypothetical protein
VPSWEDLQTDKDKVGEEWDIKEEATDRRP